MDFDSICSLLVIVISFYFSYQYLLSLTRKKQAATLLPPGKTGWPVIGETLEFIHNCKMGHPEDFVFNHMTKYSPKAFKTHIFGEPTVVLCGPNGNKFLFSNENRLVKQWWPSNLDRIFEPDTETNLAEEMKKMKKIPHILTPEILKLQISTIDIVAQKHFADAWDDKERVFVYPSAIDFALTLSCRVFLSVEDPEQVRRLAEPFHLLASGILSIPIDFLGTQFNSALKAAKSVRSLLGSIVRQRRSDLNEGKLSEARDILSQMIVASDGDGKVFEHDSDIVNRIMGFIVAGRDTTAIACTSIVKYLAELPDVYEKVYKEQMEIARSESRGEPLKWDDVQKMKYSWNVACEVMRLAPPGLGSFREAIVDFEYEAALECVHDSLGSQLLSGALEFDPSRFKGSGPDPYNTFVPFGGGPRMCGGREYARAEILVFMHHLVRRFKWDKIIPDEKIVVDPMPVPEKGLPVRLYPHKAY